MSMGSSQQHVSHAVDILPNARVLIFPGLFISGPHSLEILVARKMMMKPLGDSSHKIMK